MTNQSAESLIRDLFRKQSLAVLSTSENGWPYTNLVAFAAQDNLRTVLFATPRPSRKHTNLLHDSRVALLIDSRTGSQSDFKNAAAVTVLGLAQIVNKSENPDLINLYTQKHPSLTDFVQNPQTDLICVRVKSCLLVDNFQHTTNIIIE